MRDFPLKEFQKGEVIFKEGETANVAYILKEGDVEISLAMEGQSLILDRLQPGAIFGEMALLLPEHRRTATAIAVKNSIVIVVFQKALEEYITKSPIVIVSLLNAFSIRLQKTTGRLLCPRNLFFSISKILNLLLVHSQEVLRYNETVEAIASALFVETAQIKESMEHMATLNLIKISDDSSGVKMVRILYGKEEFMAQTLRVNQALSKLRE